MAKKALTVAKAQMLALFAALGFKNTAKLTLEKIQERVDTNLKEVLDDDELKIEDVEMDKLANSILDQMKAKGKVQVVDDAAAEDAANQEPVHPPKEPAKKGGKKEAAAKPEKKEKPAKVEKPKGKYDGTPGVRVNSGRPYLAGVVIKKHGGLKAGVTDAMVDEVDKLYGKENKTQTKFDLQSAWHSIRGYLEGEKDTAAAAE